MSAEAAPLRIVSLLPAATELVDTLGLGASLVGRSHECDWPSAVRDLPVCTRSLVVDGPGREIDTDVRERMATGQPLYEIDAETVQRLAPTHLLTQAQCDVCAVGEEQVDAMLASDWSGPAPEVVALTPHTLGDVFADLQRLGDALGASAAARRAATELAERVSLVGEKTGALHERPSVLCLEWLDPPIVSGSWVPELIRVAGGDPLFGRVGAPSEDVGWAEIAAADPDVIVLMPCGFDLERTLVEARDLERVPEWRALRAVHEGRVTAVDGNAWFNRPGPRLVESLELLAEILAPERFDFGLRARGAAPFPMPG